MMLITIVVPVFNESAGIEFFHTQLLLPKLKELKDYAYEVIYVNDGSSDNTLDILTKIARKNKHVKVINLSRNFGKEIATSAGISMSKGDATIIMDGDGQHPPAMMEKFIKKWQQGAQVVVGIRDFNEKEGFVKRYGSKIFYKIFNDTAGVKLVPRSTDYRLIDKVVRNEFLKFNERNRITRGLIDWLGFRREYVNFNAPARFAGEASYKTSQLIKLAANSFVSLSLKPLFFFGWVGTVITLLSFIMGVFILIEQFILDDPLSLGFSGPFMLGIFMSFMVGLILISQAVLATYVSHIHTHTQARPLFVVDPTNSVNLEN